MVDLFNLRQLFVFDSLKLKTKKLRGMWWIAGDDDRDECYVVYYFITKIEGGRVGGGWLFNDRFSFYSFRAGDGWGDLFELVLPFIEWIRFIALTSR